MSAPEYQPSSLGRPEVDREIGLRVLDFGTAWCGHCRRARSIVDAVIATTPSIRHLRIEDGPGRPLGRSFRVKLWPTLIFLRDGQEIARLVRPQSEQEVRHALMQLTNV